ncbi:hypothetical protein SAMN05192573_104184 [Mucilaginibacter gossypii]|uniref:Uncharacterized protein n=1 Tax=Mucilaginibacter gossypii TaxID=551996 RepID=A0A1G7VWJ0_9SPHI|nr:hypothetical protein SAMN05192573_104184 [Mucilaginibacter gossypii]
MLIKYNVEINDKQTVESWREKEISYTMLNSLCKAYKTHNILTGSFVAKRIIGYYKPAALP